MSSCAASYYICSPRASFVSATSASSPTGGVPLCYRFASQHWPPFHREPNQKPPPPSNRNLFGVVPSAADRWQSSNDLPLLNSNSVLHHRWSPLPHETARPQLENSARFTAPRPRSSYCSTDPSPLSLSRPIRSSLPPASPSRAPSSLSVRTPANFNTSPSLHSICISPASAAPAASF